MIKFFDPLQTAPKKPISSICSTERSFRSIEHIFRTTERSFRSTEQILRTIERNFRTIEQIFRSIEQILRTIERNLRSTEHFARKLWRFYQTSGKKQFEGRGKSSFIEWKRSIV